MRYNMHSFYFYGLQYQILQKNKLLQKNVTLIFGYADFTWGFHIKLNQPVTDRLHFHFVKHHICRLFCSILHKKLVVGIWCDLNPKISETAKSVLMRL